MADTTFAATILASSLACVVTASGIYVISRYEVWGRRNIVYFMGFAAGVLVSVSLLHIVPQAIQIQPSAGYFLLAGFLGLYVFNYYLNLFVCRHEVEKDYAFGLIPMIGIGFHSLLDGVIYAVTFNVDTFTGVLAAVGMILHEFPEGIVTFLLLDQAGFGKRRAVVFAFLAAAISTPLGTLLVYPFIDSLERTTLGALLALSAGALLYVGASHLLPEVEKANKRYSILSLAVGVLVAVYIVVVGG